MDDKYNLNSQKHIPDKKPELLSPAGDFQAFLGAVNAGADAVYLAGNMYGARAYATNFSEEEILEALDYAHVHQKKIYLTVNTLTKNEEAGNLYEFLKPFYLAGLDGVIVQDIGVFRYIKETFPDLPLHVSTQMAISSVYGAKLLKDMGASRIVPARELSLDEVKKINDLGIETECFIHGSMCYSYSGICLFSSFLGGRSGNRGRCAGPCRQPYCLEGMGKKEKEQYILSLKDLCTLEILPKLIDSGITSFKIEGRMKAASYAAGTAAVYRKYIDLYYDKDKPYKVDKADLEALYGLYLRSDLQRGYYEKARAREMVSVSSPSYNKTNEEYCARLTERYCRKKEPVRMKAHGSFVTGSEAVIRIVEDFSENGYYESEENETVIVSGDTVLKALNAPLSKEDIKKRFAKSSGGLFSFDLVIDEMSDDAFLPVKALNDLRRRAEEVMSEKLREKYFSRRIFEDSDVFSALNRHGQSGINHNGFIRNIKYKYFITTRNQLKTVSEFIKEGDAVCVPAYFSDMRLLSGLSVPVYVYLPYVLRQNNVPKLTEYIEECEKMPAVAGYYCNQHDSISLLRDMNVKKEIIGDYGLIIANNGAVRVAGEIKDAFTVSPELSFDDMKDMDLNKAELYAYGKIPLMQTANCVLNTTNRCRKANACGRGNTDALSDNTVSEKDFVYIKDRKNVSFAILPHCSEKVCYNTIYNSVPISLHKHFNRIAELGTGTLQLRFSDEDAEKTKSVLTVFAKIRENENIQNAPYDFTNGHFIKGVL